MLFEFVQIAYWLALSTWFGAVLFVALAPPIIQRTVRESNPILPNVLSVNLEGQHGTLLAGMIMQNLFSSLVWIELACGGVLLIATIAHFFLIDISGGAVARPILRSALLIAAIVLMVYDWRVVWPKILKYRQEYIDHADEPDVANPALDQFDKYQGESLRVLMIILCLLLGMILFSGDIRPSRTQTVVFTPQS
jgi:hypothetical protein